MFVQGLGLLSQSTHQQPSGSSNTRFCFFGQFWKFEMVLYYMCLPFMVLVYMVCLESQNSTAQLEKRYNRPPNAPKCPELRA